MKNAKKALVIVLCAILLVAASVMGTVAYLTDTKEVTNTFSVGDVKITLLETKVDENGVPVDGANPVAENSYHLLPGHTYVKDPTVTVVEKSEKAYVRMLVSVNDMSKLEGALPAAQNAAYYEDGVFQIEKLWVDKDGKSTWDSAKWLDKGFNSKLDAYEFWYFEPVEKSNSKTRLEPLFAKLTVPGVIDNTHLAYLNELEISVTAHAIQADGFATADLAWEAF